MDPAVRQFLIRWPQTLAVGAITLAPLALTVWALWLLAKLAALLGSLVIRPIGAWFGAGPPGVFTTVLEILTAVIILTVVGILARGAAGKAVGQAVDDLIGRIPIGRTVYSSAQKLIASFQSPMEQAQKVVLIDFPSEEMKTVGLVTQIFTAADTGEELAAVYVPTTPNPTSGYVEIVPVDRLVWLDWTLNEAVQFVVSAGVTAPERIKYRTRGPGATIPGERPPEEPPPTP
ncbi:MAG: DUF502 domain-containing protein [Pseudomonadota bacterium]|nr:DUF502 domain-containing protein [Caulobacteraceae bacterium]MDX5394446.1 DUF502 domain-containing protein [Caulobacteraceae bacterium]